MNRRVLFRDFILINILGGLGIAVMFGGILLQMKQYIPNPQCVFLQATHLYCPGCGGTRAFFSMLKGQLWRSVRYNPAVVLGAILILYYEVTVIMTIVGKKGKVYYCRKPWPVYVYVGIVIIYAIVRNILLAVYGIDLMG